MLISHRVQPKGNTIGWSEKFEERVLNLLLIVQLLAKFTPCRIKILLHKLESESPVTQRRAHQYQQCYLNPETAESLKKPSFNVWGCSTEEMVCYIEYMYCDLGLLSDEGEITISPVTLQRWLVSWS